jgi:membrane associated rhomboid family serine protease
LDFGEALATTAVSPSTVFGQLQLYRVVTAAFTHGGVLHVGMNMLSLVSLGSSLEPLFGSLGFFFLTLLYTVLVLILLRFGYTRTLERVTEALPSALQKLARRVFVLNA